MSMYIYLDAELVQRSASQFDRSRIDMVKERRGSPLSFGDWECCTFWGMKLYWDYEAGQLHLMVNHFDIGLPEAVLDMIAADPKIVICAHVCHEWHGKQPACRIQWKKKSPAIAVLTKRYGPDRISLELFSYDLVSAWNRYRDVRHGSWINADSIEPLDGEFIPSLPQDRDEK